MFSFIAIPLGYAMELIYNLVSNYGIALIIFTIAIRIVLFPLDLKQQKSMARMSAYQPLINEIRQKYAKNPQRQQEEMMRLQQEYGYSATAGCLPMAINFFILFGIIDVVYKPLTYILHISAEVVTALQTAGDITARSAYQLQSAVIHAVQTNPDAFSGVADAEIISRISNFNFMFLGIDLSQVPTVGFNVLVIIPILSIITMVASQIIMQKTSGQQLEGSMKYMPWITGAMFVYFGFTVPVAFSLYYTVSNLAMLVKQLIVRRIYDPEVIKKQIADEVEAKKKEKKKKKVVTVENEKGEKETKEVNDAQMASIRLQLAREQDAVRYADERTVRLTDAERAALAEQANDKKKKKKKNAETQPKAEEELKPDQTKPDQATAEEEKGFSQTEQQAEQNVEE